MAITRSQLAKYNGKNGNPAYVAYQGRVWDVSKTFINGQYKGLQAGTDLTNQLEMYDGAEALQHGIIVCGLSDE